MRLGEARAKGSRVWSSLAAALTVIAVLGAVSPRFAVPSGRAALADFVDKNHVLLETWLAKPPSFARDQHLQAIRGNLRWAEGCLTGHNSDLDEIDRPLAVD